jgi:hypothetical protein
MKRGVEMAELTKEQQEQVLADLRWYGKTIAGGGPMGGYDKVARRAERHWYEVTLPLLMELSAVYPDAEAIQAS